MRHLFSISWLSAPTTTFNILDSYIFHHVSTIQHFVSKVPVNPLHESFRFSVHLGIGHHLRKHGQTISHVGTFLAHGTPRNDQFKPRLHYQEHLAARIRTGIPPKRRLTVFWKAAVRRTPVSSAPRGTQPKTPKASETSWKVRVCSRYLK